MYKYNNNTSIHILESSSSHCRHLFQAQHVTILYYCITFIMNIDGRYAVAGATARDIRIGTAAQGLIYLARRRHQWHRDRRHARIHCTGSTPKNTVPSLAALGIVRSTRGPRRRGVGGNRCAGCGAAITPTAANHRTLWTGTWT